MERNVHGSLPFEMLNFPEKRIHFLASLQQTLLEEKVSEPEIQGTEYYQPTHFKILLISTESSLLVPSSCHISGPLPQSPVH